MKLTVKEVKTVKLLCHLVDLRLAPANDTVPTAQDLAVREIDAEWLRIHKRTFRGKRMRITVQLYVEIETEELVTAFLPNRVQAWRVLMTELVPAGVESFLFPVSK
jgi:hypothetical protein